MGFRDTFRKRDPAEGDDKHHHQAAPRPWDNPEFTFLRTDTSSQEVIYPPAGNTDGSADELADKAGNSDSLLSPNSPVRSSPRRSLDFFRSRSGSTSSQASNNRSPSSRRRLSQRLHLARSPASSDYVPQDLPDITVSNDDAQWERRATILAESKLAQDVAAATVAGLPEGLASMSLSRRASHSSQRPTSPGPDSTAPVSSQAIDGLVQEAIRLHEEGNFKKSTELFGRLADPQGANNPLSQILYGLALRHGWGCNEDQTRAVEYLTAAASNSAVIEQLALQAGMMKGGAAKGELVLAIYELANCFRNGWGVKQDAVAAKEYYETAANLGDVDAMNEVAYCYFKGIGCKKDMFAAARYYRQAEKAGEKIPGNSWIWKEKYNTKA